MNYARNYPLAPTGIGPGLDAMLAQPEGASSFETRERVLAVRQMTGVYGPHSLDVAQENPLHVQVRSFELAQLHIAQIRYGSEVVASMSQAHPYWVFAYVRSGTTRSRTLAGPCDADSDVSHGAGSAGVNSPETLMDLAMSADAELLNLRVREEDMRAACRSLFGPQYAQGLQFDSRAAAGSAASRTLLRVIRQLGEATRFCHPAASRYELTVREAALYELLLGWPNNAARAIQEEPALPASTQLARDFIHANAYLAPTVAEIADAAGVGVRALALGFEKHFGMSPMRYLQRVRLEGVRSRLLTAREGDTVMRIALDWGFANPGVLAARYRERFGESPAETLRRQRPH